MARCYQRERGASLVCVVVSELLEGGTRTSRAS